MNKRLVLAIVTGAALIAGTIVAIQFAKGYRFNTKEKKLLPTGLLVANSFPTGAQVFIDENLTTATDDTLNLPPADYHIKLIKDGYLPWEKNLSLKKELVTQTNATLFPSVPNLNGLTYTGALNISPSPDGQKIAYSVASASSELKNGLWIFDLSSRALSFSRDPRQIARNTSQIDYTKAKLLWSPDSKQIIASFNNSNTLIMVDRFNNPEDLRDITARLALTLQEWQEEIRLKEEKRIEKLPLFLQNVATASAKNLYWSPEEDKLMYTATASASIPENLIPPIPSTNNQNEEREIKPDKIYVYDLKEDKNFFIADLPVKTEEKQPQKTVNKKDSALEKFNQLQAAYSPLGFQQSQWFPSSRHIILVENNKITIMEYDATNKAVVYAGPLEANFVYPWPDGSKLLIATSLNRETPYPPNLYAISLK